MKFTVKSIYCCGRHFQILCQIFSLPHISKTVQLTGKSQPNAEPTFWPALNTLNSNIESVNAFAMSFADIQRKGYKFSSILDSVGELSGDKF